MVVNMSLFSVNAILIMATDDRSRLMTRYYNPPHQPAGSTGPGSNPWPTVKEQKAFEKGLMEKTNKTTSDVILYDNQIVVYKMEGDVMLYVVGNSGENEVMLFNVVLALRDSLAVLLKNTDRRSIIENYDLVSLAADEIIDDGIILETDPVIIVNRVTRPPTEDMPNIRNIELSEQGLLNAWEFGKKKLADRIRQGL